MKSPLGEADLNGKGYSANEERRILDALGRGLSKEFPNPERVGCPGSDVLRRIASHQMPLSEAEKWLDHLGSCSPCYADFKRLQEAHESSRRRMLLATAAGILLAVSVVGWALLHKRNDNLGAETAVLDLRDRSLSRGSEPSTDGPPLEVSRTSKGLLILLPLGSDEGTYDVRIGTLAGEQLAAATGAAKLKDHVASFRVELSLDSMSRGTYVLQIRKTGSEWSHYPLELR